MAHQLKVNACLYLLVVIGQCLIIWQTCYRAAEFKFSEIVKYTEEYLLSVSGTETLTFQL